MGSRTPALQRAVIGGRMQPGHGSAAAAGTSRPVLQPLRRPATIGRAATSGDVRAVTTGQYELVEQQPAHALATGAPPPAKRGTTGSADVAPLPPLTGRVACFAARKHASRDVTEAARSLPDYMALPASQYSVLDARRIERIDDTTFRCYVGRLGFAGLVEVEPVITVAVEPAPRGCSIRLLSARLRGGRLAEEVDAAFRARMNNSVTWADTQAPGVKSISSDTLIEVDVAVPAWAGMLPLPSLEAAGSRVIQAALNVMVPRFLEQLSRDYARWAAGDESRAPVDSGGGGGGHPPL